MEEKKTVLVTGGSGFIATHCIIKLTAAGFNVRSTVRDLGRTNKLNQVISDGLQEYEGQSELAIDWKVANLTESEGWKEAMEGCDYVLHVASPVMMENPKDENELITPALEGTKNVLRAASVAGVKRVVVTSSVAAILYGRDDEIDEDFSFNEEHWTDVNHKNTSAYAKSKTLAEKAAWEFIEKDSSGMELSVVNPAMVFGPVLEEDYGTSVGVILEMMSGNYPMVPNMDMGIVDVRDVADLQLLAMTRPEAAGKRFVCSESNMMMKEQTDFLRDAFPEFQNKIPTREAPTWLLKLFAFLRPPLKMIAPELGKNRKLDSSRAKELLGWKPRPAKEAIKAAAESLIKFDSLN